MENRTGFLSLTCTKKAEKTILQDAYYEGALKISRPIYLTSSGEAYLYMMNPGGGYVDGDTYQLKICVNEEANAVLTTQSSTKIYKTPQHSVRQDMEIILYKRSTLEYLPDPIIAYENARFKQQTTVRMEKGASFICTDIYTPGWAPDGRLFRYDLIQSRMDIYLDNKLILFDHVKLEPDEAINEIGCMEGYTHFGTMAVINEQVDRAFIDEINELLQSLTGARIGLSMLTVPGFSLRVLANSTQETEKVLRCCYDQIRIKIFHKESSFLRKY